MATLDYQRRLGRVEARLGWELPPFFPVCSSKDVPASWPFFRMPFQIKKKDEFARKATVFMDQIRKKLASAAALIIGCSLAFNAQSQPVTSSKASEHKSRISLAAQGIHSLNWQGESEQKNLWLLQAQIESALNWKKGPWVLSFPIDIEGQAAWIPDSVYSITNDRLQLGANLGWHLMGHDSLPNALLLETKIRLETRWMHKSWIEKLKSFSKGNSTNLVPPDEPHLLNPGIVFLSFGLSVKLWKELHIHAGLAGAKMNFVLSRFPGSDSLNYPVWGIEPQGPNPHVFWGWNTELAWHHSGKLGESYALKVAVFSLPEHLQHWSGRAKAEVDFPLSRAVSLGYRVMWSYEPAQVASQQWQHTFFIRLGWPATSN